MILAKLALGFASTMIFATVYTFREGVIRVDVDEHRDGGSHVHLWAPAAVVPLAMHFVPKEHFREAARHANEFLPVVQALSSELRKYPDSTFVEVQDDHDHVRVSTVGTKIQIDVVNPEENVHVTVPLRTINEVVEQIAGSTPGV